MRLILLKRASFITLIWLILPDVLGLSQNLTQAPPPLTSYLPFRTRPIDHATNARLQSEQSRVDRFEPVNAVNPFFRPSRVDRVGTTGRVGPLLVIPHGSASVRD